MIKQELSKDIIDALKFSETARNSTSFKQFAITFLQSKIRDYGGEMVPQFSECGRILDIPKETLFLWWKNRDAIMKEEGKPLIDYLTGIVKETTIIGLTIVQNEILQRLSDPIQRAELTTKELISINKLLFSNNMILNRVSGDGGNDEISPYNPSEYIEIE